ncbi:AAA family ATPase [Roseomonas sp. OT10]|uniref:cellulose synthase operon protein YhjQ/BcsQ n=1 Tax=Roseomonas cutis TaxID=2897332 RepID=UPI001E5982C6|nr:cellulose synthase operon protein YhjQ/BcsQ [Roseomonas sp. OT10]UFN47306.1 AAA family ATPase [Roseomonas sp. OT10]
MPLICFTSPKGGVGKTTLAANIAYALSQTGRRILAIDCDPQNALRLHFGAPIAEQEGWLGSLLRQPDMRPALRHTGSGVVLLPYGASDMTGALGLDVALERQPQLLTGPVRALLADGALTIVADMPPGPSQALAALAPIADMIVCVLAAEPMSAALVPEIESGRFLGGGVAGTAAGQRLRVVVNAVNLDSNLSRSAAEAVARHVGWRLLGAVGREEVVAEALACQRLVLDHAPHSRAAADLREVTAAINETLAAPQQGQTYAWGSR